MPGVNPVWNELIFVFTTDESVPAEGKLFFINKNKEIKFKILTIFKELIIFLIDENRQSNRAEFRIPWGWLVPFYQYHLELVMVCL